MTTPSLVILRVGSGYYLRDFDVRLATWVRDPLTAGLYTLDAAEATVRALDRQFPRVALAARTWDPVLESITRTQRFAPPDDPTLPVIYEEQAVAV